MKLKAIDLITDKIKDTFPKIITRGEDYFLMSDVQGNGTLYYELATKQKLTKSDMRITGKCLFYIHNILREVSTHIRDCQSNKIAYDNYLYWRFGFCRNNKINTIVDQLKSLPNKQLILGDLNPKNLFLAEKQLRIFDLETMHVGDREFDIGFFLGHILLNYFNRPEKCEKLVKSFFTSYDPQTIDESITVKISLATIYYRLNSKYEYTTIFRIPEKKQIMKSISYLIEQNISNYDALFVIMKI